MKKRNSGKNIIYEGKGDKLVQELLLSDMKIDSLPVPRGSKVINNT
ncbi:MAG: hypothetical protein ACLU4J_21880 [Butyricimonas paravirosa]